MTTDILKTDDEIDAFLAEIIKNPDKISEVNNLHHDDIIKLSKKLSPYTYIGNEDIKKTAMISYTNLEEEYMKRFLITGLIGFVYRMQSEYEIPKDVRTWKEAKDVENVSKEMKEPFKYKQIKAYIDLISSSAETMKVVETEINKIDMKRTVCVCNDTELPQDEVARYEMLQQRHALINYGITVALLDFGKVAEAKYESVYELNAKYKENMEEIRQRPIKIKDDSEKEVPQDVASNIIKDFLNHYFEYNPDDHVKSVIGKNPINVSGITVDKDNTRPSLQLLHCRDKCTDVKIQKILDNREQYNAFMYFLNNRHNEELMSTTVEILSNPDKYWQDLVPIRRELNLLDHIPPQDTFFRYGYYLEVNMEEIRQVVSAVYHDKPMLDIAMIVYDTFEGTDEEIQKKKNEFMNAHGGLVICDVMGVPIGKWTFIGNFKENRKNIDFLNRETEVLSRILDRYEEDKKLGVELMKNRAKKDKIRSIKEHGPDSELMKQYQKQICDIATLGAERALTEKELEALEIAKDNIKLSNEVNQLPDDALEVKVYNFDTKNNDLTSSHFYTSTVAPDNTQISANETPSSLGSM